MVEFFDLLPGFSFDILKCILNVKFLPELLTVGVPYPVFLVALEKCASVIQVYPDPLAVGDIWCLMAEK